MRSVIYDGLTLFHKHLSMVYLVRQRMMDIPGHVSVHLSYYGIGPFQHSGNVQQRERERNTILYYPLVPFALSRPLSLCFILFPLLNYEIQKLLHMKSFLKEAKLPNNKEQE